jgi:hypothetical protein
MSDVNFLNNFKAAKKKVFLKKVHNFLKA